MPALRILREAAEELDAAAAYLERQRPGYAALFLDAYEERLRQLARFPASGPAIQNAPGGYPLRAFLIGKFPYSIIAGPIDGVTMIVALAHTSREPGCWRGRVD
jgi:plasmid stabilization system protein ParE